MEARRTRGGREGEDERERVRMCVRERERERVCERERADACVREKQLPFTRARPIR